MPINIHRFIANIAFGGSDNQSCRALNFLQAETDEERAHYDWMGYIGNFVAISAFLPLPFATTSRRKSTRSRRRWGSR